MGVIAGVHYGTSYSRSPAHIADSTSLTVVYVFVIYIGNLTDSSLAADRDLSHLAGGKSDKSVSAFLTHELSLVACASYELSALSGIELDSVDECTNRDVLELESVAGLDVSLGAGLDLVAYLEAVGSEDVSLLAVLVLNESDECRAVRIVFDRLDRKSVV